MAPNATPSGSRHTSASQYGSEQVFYGSEASAQHRTQNGGNRAQGASHATQQQQGAYVPFSQQFYGHAHATDAQPGCRSQRLWADVVRGAVPEQPLYQLYHVVE